MLANVACHEPSPVKMKDNKYSPEVANNYEFSHIIVDWTNTGNNSHTATSIGDGTFFDSGNVGPGGTYSKVIENAGTFQYSCALIPKMRGTVKVGMWYLGGGDPPFTTDSDFTVGWAGSEDPDDHPASIPSGFDADIQVKRDDGKFKDFLIDRTGSQTETEWHPDRPGTYLFRARLQHATTGVATKYSPSMKLVIRRP